MKGGRLTIAGMLLLCGCTAVAAAALRSPTILWTQIIVTGSLTCLLAAAVAALMWRGDRSFAIGFAVVGWAYLLLSLGPWCEEHVGPWLLSTRIADEIHLRWVDSKLSREVILSESTRPWHIAESEQFGAFPLARHRRIAHGLFAVAHGVIGGLLGVAFARPGRGPGRGASP